MPKHNIIVTPPAFHETRFGRAVLGGAAVLVTAGAAYWMFAPEQPNEKPTAATSAKPGQLSSVQVSPFAAPVAASSALAGRLQLEPEAPRYDSVSPAPSRVGTRFVTLYPDVLSALQQLQSDDLDCRVQRYSHRPTPDGLVATMNSMSVMDKVIKGCNLAQMQQAFESAAETTTALRVADAPLGLQAAEDTIFPPVLIQVTATPQVPDAVTPGASHTLVCEQEGNMRANNLQFKCHLGPS